MRFCKKYMLLTHYIFLSSMLLLHFTKNEFLLLGLRLSGYKLQKDSTTAKVSFERFKNHFYVTSLVCEIVFLDLQTTTIPESFVDNANLIQFLIGLLYLKQYPEKYGLAAFYGVCKKTALYWSNFYVKKIQGLKKSKIKWIFGTNFPENEEIFIISIDEVHCQISEPRTAPSAGWFSKTPNGHGLSYEQGILIFRNQICRIKIMYFESIMFNE